MENRTTQVENKEVSKKEKSKIEKYKFHVISVFFIIIFAISISPRTIQNDIFYTIKVGEYISQNGIGNLTQDPFSWVELPYTFPHWLYDLMMYKIYNLGSWDGIFISTMIFTSILGISIYTTSNKISKNAPVSTILTFVALYGLRPYITARAQLVTFSLMVLTIFLIENFLEKGKKRYALGLVGMSLLIANLHMAVWPFFFVLFLPYIAEYFLSLNIITIDLIVKLKIIFYKYIAPSFTKKTYEEKIELEEEKIRKNKIRREENRKNPYKIRIIRNDNMKKLLLVMLICLCMGLLTPTGPTTPYTYLVKTMQGNTTNVINEHLPLDLRSNNEFVAFFVFFIVLLTFIDVKIDLKNLCYYLGILYLAIESRRQVSMFIVICTPILAKIIAEIFEKYAPEVQEKVIRFINQFYVKACITTVLIIIMLRDLNVQRQTEAYTNSTYPIEAAKWIKENLDYENIRLFNEYNYGSYLVFEGIPVLIDSRADLYAPEFNGKNDIFMDVQNVATGDADYKDVFEDYDITHIITYKNSRLSKKLKSNSDYQLIYPTTTQEKENDANFVIYKKLTETDKEETEKEDQDTDETEDEIIEPTNVEVITQNQ